MVRVEADRRVIGPSGGFLQGGKPIGTIVVASGHAGPGVRPVCDGGVGTVSCIVELRTRDIGGCQYQDEGAGDCSWERSDEIK